MLVLISTLLLDGQEEIHCGIDFWFTTGCKGNPATSTFTKPSGTDDSCLSMQANGGRPNYLSYMVHPCFN